jgi:hypothetical protein
MRGWLTLFCAVVLVSMIAVTIWASGDKNVLMAFVDLWADPWGRATLFDAYFAFLTFYLWVAYRETSWIARVFWFLYIVAFGNIAMATYLLWRLWRLPKGAGVAELLLRRP